MGRRLIATGAHPKLISTRLGHSSIAITMDRYGHLLPSLDEAATAGLEATYWGLAHHAPNGVRQPS